MKSKQVERKIEMEKKAIQQSLRAKELEREKRVLVFTGGVCGSMFSSVSTKTALLYFLPA